MKYLIVILSMVLCPATAFSEYVDKKVYENWSVSTSPFSTDTTKFHMASTDAEITSVKYKPLLKTVQFEMTCQGNGIQTKVVLAVHFNKMMGFFDYPGHLDDIKTVDFTFNDSSQYSQHTPGIHKSTLWFFHAKDLLTDLKSKATLDISFYSKQYNDNIRILVNLKGAKAALNALDQRCV